MRARSVWDGNGRLTVYDKTQGVQNVHKFLCSVFGKKPDDIRVLSPYVGGAFGSGLRPQYQVVLATLGALALKRSVRVVLTRQQMYGLGHRPATIERVALGAKSDGTLDAVTHEATAVTSRYEDFCAQRHRLGGTALQKPEQPLLPQARPSRRLHALRHARAWRGFGRLRARMRHGRAGGRAQARPDRTAAEVLLGSRPERRPALHQQAVARMLRPRRRSLRLEQTQSCAALDARRQGSGRLGHGDRRLGGTADAGRSPHRADRQWPCRGVLRRIRHRHRHLHHRGAGGGRCARACRSRTSA